MPSPLGANINNGVLIDLSALNGINYDAASGTVVVGAGNRWADVYRGLDPYNVTVVGGRELDVGVGGLTLGSGLSYLSDLYGLVCDNVAEFQVVLGNGSAIMANDQQHQDLFWALKGGSNNFGLVTSFKLFTYPIHQVWGGIKTYSLEQLPALFQATLEYQLNPDKDPYANFMLQAFPTNASVGAVMNMVYLKPVESPAAFAPFYNISTRDDTTMIQTLTEMISGQQVPGIPRWDWFATSFRPDNDLYEQILEIVTTAPELANITALTSGSLAIGLQPISESAVLAARKRSNRGNALGLETVNQTWFVLDTGWYSAKDDTIAHKSTSAIHDKIRAAAVQKSLDLPYIFMNDASYSQQVIASYGSDNVEMLRGVQKKYDPLFVFQELVPGGFKLDLET
ncbi:hypothetical protein VPNG_05899 [Cytospora leucostoma]|uniref:FAD-binding PCMH-type domain-containing protein n=1 Tax=Cytospora leucostoma TaxID=1230097 RepID=A0A423X0M7_9PEZI|nr:hypothetical protein VPNG_05899 [Cytospora leucostoma]